MGNACGRKRPQASRDSSLRSTPDNDLSRLSLNDQNDGSQRESNPSPRPSMKRSTTPAPNAAMTASRPRVSAKRVSTPRPSASRSRDRDREREKERAKERERERELEDENNNDDPIQKFIGYALSKGVSGLRAEFEELRLKTIPTKEQCSIFHMGANAQKNRYKDVPCSDDSRVILKELSMGTDYIHGNFCGTPKNPKRFICTQGPLPTTIVDFWSMVWQEGSEFIVMLCNFNEMGKVKCAQYFPPMEKETLVAGNAVITCESVARQKWPGTITIRRFTLDRIDVNQKRMITHLHWESWPDRGVPPIDTTIQKLLQMVCRSSKPAVVHCSAGIGRTGTTVAIQIVTELMDSGKSMETGLSPFLVKMRKQRAGSVQNDQQYVFIHRLLLERYMSEEEKDNPKFAKFVRDYDALMVMVAEHHHRETIPSKNHSHRFLITPDDTKECFERQFYHFYNARFVALKSRVEASAKKYIDPNVVVRLLEDLPDEEMALVIGTIEKREDSRPSILKEIAEDEQKISEAGENQPAPCHSLFKKQDYMEFEDETQIVKLSGNIDMKEVPNGSIVGLYGKMVKANLFEVDRMVWPSPAEQNELPDERPPYTIAFISGLNLSGLEPATKTRGALELLVRWITGCSNEKEAEKASRVVRLFICGSSISAPDAATEMREMAISVIREEPFADQIALNIVDDLITILTKYMEVDVLPGLGDPSMCMFPQQPIPKKAFTKGGKSSFLRMHTNPSDITIAGIDFIVSSGQNVSDLSTSPVEAISLILKSQHISPTCPDTVDGFPFEDRDPFVIDRCFPHVVVAGNQSRAESKQVDFEDGRSCLMVGVPSFSESHSITLLDLDTLQVSQKHFGFD